MLALFSSDLQMHSRYSWSLLITFEGTLHQSAIHHYSSLSTSNLSETMKNMHVLLIKAANSLMSSHPGLPMSNVWWIDSNSYSQEGMSSKQEWSTDAYSSLFVTIHYILFDLLDIQYSSWPNNNNIESNHHQSSGGYLFGDGPTY